MITDMLDWADDAADEIARVAASVSFKGPLPHLPRTRADLTTMFGSPGTLTLDKAWERANIVDCHGTSGDHPSMPGVPAKWYFRTHRLAEPYFREALRRAQEAAPDYRMERASSFNFRHQRHDPKRPLSAHSWGVAIDVDPALNFARTFTRGTRPAPWSPEWMKIWPKGLPRAFVEAMTSIGLTWGGWWLECDPMHFCLAPF